MRRLLLAGASVVALTATALAQSTPNFSYGQVPTAGEWNSAFARKQDYLGFPPLNSNGGSMTGKLYALPPSTGSAGINLGVGTAPGAPVSGDVWITPSGMYYFNGNTVVGPIGSGGGGGGSTFGFQVDRLTVEGTNTLSTLTKNFDGQSIQLNVDGGVYTNTGSSPAFTVATGGDVITWNSANAGFSITTGDNVTASYTASGVPATPTLGAGVSAALQAVANGAGGILATPPTVECDGVTDDTSAIVNYVAATGSIILPVGTCLFSSGVYPTTGGKIRGRGQGKTILKLTTGAGVNALSITGSGGFTPGTGNFTSGIYDLTIDGSSAASMNGYVLSCSGAPGFEVENVVFQFVPNFAKSNCDDFKVHNIDGFNLAPATGIGFHITGGSFFIDGEYYQSTIPGGYPDDAAAWIQIDATTAVAIGDRGVISDVRRGVYIDPGLGQTAEYIHVGGVQFDQCSEACTEGWQQAGGTIHGLYFVNTWSSTSPINIYLHADSGSIDTVQLTGVQAKGGVDYNLEAINVNNLTVIGGDLSGAGYSLSSQCQVSGNTVTLTGSPTPGFSFNTAMMFAATYDGSTNGNGQIVIGGTTYHLNNVLSLYAAQLTTTPGTIASTTCTYAAAARQNIYIGGTSSKVVFENIKAGLSTDGNGQGVPLNGIYLDTSVDNPTISGNDLTGVTTPLTMAKSSAYTTAFVHDNRGVDDQYSSSTPSGGTLAIGVNPVVAIQSSLGVSTISGPAWPNRIVQLLSVAGANSYSTGGNIANALTSTNLTTVSAEYIAGTWRLR